MINHKCILINIKIRGRALVSEPMNICISQGNTPFWTPEPHLSFSLGQNWFSNEYFSICNYMHRNVIYENLNVSKNGIAVEGLHSSLSCQFFTHVVQI